MNKLSTINDVAEHLKVKVSWVRSQVFKQTIPFIKIGRHIRFDIEAIDKWVALNSHITGGHHG